jgi:hypothetical protein
MQRSDIEMATPEMIATNLARAFEKYCAVAK